jgi:hypothetical protein
MTKRYDDLPKALKREIRELASVVHERLLAVELRRLDGEFVKWRAGEMDAFELSAVIHKFHEGLPRELWLKFNSHDVRELGWYVSAALADRTMREDEVSVEVRQFLARK